MLEVKLAIAPADRTFIAEAASTVAARTNLRKNVNVCPQLLHAGPIISFRRFLQHQYFDRLAFRDKLKAESIEHGPFQPGPWSAHRMNKEATPGL